MAKQSIEEKIEFLEREVQRLKDVNEITNLVDRYEYMLEGALLEEITELFAQKTPGVRAEIGSWGVYEGIEGIKKLYPGMHKLTQGDRRSGLTPGFLAASAITTPVIEVAGDGKTAKGVWMCPGISSHPNDKGKLAAFWGWAKRAYDFVKEDGKWKIWHYHVYGIIYAPYEKGWVEGENREADMSWLPDELKPDRPTTYYWLYSTTNAVQYMPVPPEPYETFDEKDAY